MDSIFNGGSTYGTSASYFATRENSYLQIDNTENYRNVPMKGMAKPVLRRDISLSGSSHFQ